MLYFKEEVDVSPTYMLIISVIFIFVIWLIISRNKSVGHPPSVGLIKTIWMLYRSGLPMYELGRQLRYKYGGIYMINVFGKKVVFLADFPSIKEAFTNSNLLARPTLTMEQDPSLGHTGVVLASGEKWNQQRRFILEVFKDFGVGRSKFEESIEDESKHLIDEFTKLAGKQFDPNHILVNAVSNVICSLIFGKRFEYSDKRFKYFLELGTRLAMLGTKHLVLIWMPLFAHFGAGDKALKDIVECNKQLDDFISEIIENHRPELDPKHNRDLIDAYLNELKLNDTEYTGKLSLMTELNLRTTIRQLFSAGTDTTALTLRWAMLYMALYPDVQEKVHKEIDEGVGRNRLPKRADRPLLQYTQAVIFEIQRMANISRFGVPHACIKDSTVCGVTIPEGSIVMSNLWAVLRDPELWPEPWKFRPERFLDEKGQAVSRDALIPFSTGRRICLGESLARMELYIFFTHLMHQFRIEGCDWQDDTVSIVDQGRNPKDFKIRAIHRD